MSEDIFALGFSVDTSGLVQGKASAADLAKALLDLAKAMKGEEDAASKAAAAEKKKAEEVKKAAEEARRAADPHLRLADAMGRIGAQAQGVSGHIANMTQGFMQAGNSLGQGGAGGLVGGMNAMLGAGGKLVPMLGAMGGAVAGVALGVASLGVAYVGLVAATYKQQETFMLLEGRLKNVYGSGYIAAEMFKELTVLADKNGLSIDATAESFLRLARNNEAIGLTRRQMIDLTDSVQMLGRVSGASQGEVAGGLMQFSQALAAGRLNGDELRSIMENMPALTKAIADGLGVSVGQLRAMGAEGQLTSEKITGALLGQLPKIREEFDSLPQTSEQAFQRVGNAWDTLIAHIGEQLNASGIVTGTANALAYVLQGASEAVRPETTGEKYARVMASREKGLGNNGFLGLFDSFNVQKPRDDAEVLELQRKLNEERYAGIIADAKQDKDVQRAPFVRGTGLLKDGDDFNNKISALQANLKTYQEARNALAKSPRLFEPEELARLKEFDRMIAVTNQQISNTLLPLEKYAQATDRMADNVARYGAGGAASIGQEAQGLVDASLGQQNPISYDQAEGEVLRKRTGDVQTQTQAMELQIQTQQKLKDAIGGGTQAQIEAEVATKALNLQMQLFGAELTPDAAKAMEAYRDKLREVLQFTREVADATKANNAEQEIAIERALLAAQRNGANAGELKEIERNLRLIKELEQAGAPVAGPATPAGPQGQTAQPSALTIPGNRIDGNTITAGLEANITRTVAEVMAAYPQVGGISGLRAGDSGSQHSVGKAFDLDISMLSEDQKQKLVQQLLSGQFGRIGGIGTYNAEATSLHVDSREGRMAWGPNKSRSSLDQTPDWFNSMTTAWMGGADVGGSGTTAALNGATLADLKSQREEEARLLQLEQQRALLQKQIAAGTVAEARAAEREKAAKDYSTSFDPSKQQEAYNAKMAEFRLQDELAAKKRAEALDQEILQGRQQLALASMVGKEREIELRVLQFINAEKAAGNQLSEDEVTGVRQKVTVDVYNEEAERQSIESAGRFTKVWDTAAQGIGSALEDALGQAMENGKIDAEGILKGLISDITMAIMRAYITQPIVAGLQGLMGAHGLVAGPQGASMYFASGGVIDRPTPLLAGPRMLAIGGEAGPEAVLPLKRGPDGKLGVGGGNGGGGTTIVVNDMRTAQGSEPVEAQESTGPDGSRMISIIVRDEVRKQMRNGDLDKEMRSSYGVTRQITRR